MKKKLKRILKIFIIISIILLIAYIIFKEIKQPSWFADEYYIVDFENSDKNLTKEEEKSLLTMINSNVYNFKDNDNIEITKLAYQHPFRHESVCYIFLKANINSRLPFELINVTENYKEYVIKHVCLNTNDCQEFNLVRRIVNDKYKWWKKNEKKVEYTEIEEPYITQEKDNDLLKKYEVVSGENLLGQIVDITDKYLEIQTNSSDIKLVEIDWKVTNFVNYRTKESLMIYDIKKGDYFYNKQIIRNITGDELVKESLKSIVRGSSNNLFVPTKLISLTDMNGYYIAKIEMRDKTSDLLKNKIEDENTYQIEFIINSDTKFYLGEYKIPIDSTIHDLFNHKEITIKISKDSADDVYPIITEIVVGYDIKT